MDNKDIYEQMRQTVATREQEAPLLREEQNQLIKERLAKILTKKLETAFIAPLEEFEKAFGFLWGHGKPWESLSKQEKFVRKIWDTVRKQILNRGNEQIRAVYNELELYNISWKGYRAKFFPKEKD
jgi:hypothetical protein